MTTNSDPSGVWRHQARQWDLLGPPLRPCPEDSRHLEQIADAWASRNGPPRALLLGVTPEIARMRWPPATHLLAVDHSTSMIRTVWPGFPALGKGAVCANWLQLPLRPRSRGLVVSDGPLGVLRYPDQHLALLQSVRRVLQPGGLFAFRSFIRPEASEDVRSIFGEALAGRIGTFHAFKLRLLMACQPNAADGVRTGDVWLLWTNEGPGAEALAARTGWRREQIATIDAYRGQDTLYCFPTLAEVRGLFATGGFEEVACTTPSYELGERCPTLVLAPAP